MDESKVEQIIEKTLDANQNRKFHKIWKDPKKAQFITVISIYVTILSVMVLGFNITMNDVLDQTPLVESLLEEMDCESLKDVMKTPDLEYSQESLVQKYLLAECL